MKLANEDIEWYLKRSDTYLPHCFRVDRVDGIPGDPLNLFWTIEPLNTVRNAVFDEVQSKCA